MTIRLPIKGTEESIVLGFDFSDESTGVSNPTMTCLPEPGVATDDASDLVLAGEPQVDGTNPMRVLQRVHDGVDLVDYRIQCTVQSGDDILTLGAILPVRLNV